MSAINDSEISVVIQGPVRGNETVECIASIRRFLPKAEIILSTWEGADVEELDYDKVIFNVDPGSNGYIKIYPHPQVSNLNRQLVSTQNGIKAVQRKYCLKIRTDGKIINDNFLSLFPKYCFIDSDVSPLKARIMVEGLCTSVEGSFCVGDWWHFGYTEDVKKWFDTPLSKEKAGEIYFEDNSIRPFGAESVCQFSPEQYIAMNFARKYCGYVGEYKHIYDDDNNLVAMSASKKMIIDYLLCVEGELAGIVLPKAENIYSLTSYKHNLSLYKWVNLVSKYHKSINMSLLDATYSNTICKFDSEYEKNIEYNEVKHRINIIGNYSKIESVEYDITQDVQESELSFVVSGKVSNNGVVTTTDCLKSIRKFYPKATIILSIWDDQDIEGLVGLYDEVVWNDSIRSIFRYSTLLKPDYKPNSINGQHYCMNNGLKAVKTKYAVRMRTDFKFLNNHALFFYNEWRKKLKKCEKKYNLFRERVLIPRIITRDSRLIDGKFVYQLSDFFHIGTKEDLLKLWSGVQRSSDELNYFTDNPKSKYENPCNFNHLYTVEQDFFLECIRKFARKNFELPKYYFDRDIDKYMFEAEKFYASNFIIASQEQLGLYSKFNENEEPFNQDEFFKFKRFLQIYLENVDPKNDIVLGDMFQEMERQGTKRNQKHGNRFAGCNSFKNFIKNVLWKTNVPFRVGMANRNLLEYYDQRIETMIASLDNRLKELEESKKKNED